MRGLLSPTLLRAPVAECLMRVSALHQWIRRRPPVALRDTVDRLERAGVPLSEAQLGPERPIATRRVPGNQRRDLARQIDRLMPGLGSAGRCPRRTAVRLTAQDQAWPALGDAREGLPQRSEGSTGKGRCVAVSFRMLPSKATKAITAMCSEASTVRRHAIMAPLDSPVA